MEFILKIISCLACLLILVIAAIVDVKKRKIPNNITFIGIIIGIIVTLISCILKNNYRELIITIIMIILLFFFGMLHLIGLGDIKLLMAITALQGALTMALTAAIGSLAVIITALIIKPQTAKKELLMSVNSILLKLPVAKDGMVFPFAPFILIGFIISKIVLYFIIV